MVCPEESPLLASIVDNSAASNSPWRGLTRRLRRGSRACSPMGRSIASGGDPKVSKGERREAGIQWIQPPKAVSAPEFRQTTSGPHGSANRADCLPRGKPFGAPAGAYPCPRWSLTRRLRRGSRACSPMGRSHFSFDGERKVCKRKPAARRLREKGFYCPFCRRGSLCRAQHNWPDFTCDPARSELAYFRRQNGRAFFPPLPIAALAPAVGCIHTQILQVGML